MLEVSCAPEGKNTPMNCDIVIKENQLLSLKVDYLKRKKKLCIFAFPIKICQHIFRI